jgi:cholesterol transport system auxiliary component
MMRTIPTHRRRAARGLTMLLVSAMLPACALTGRSTPPPTVTYVLDGTPADEPVRNAQTTLVLKVAAPNAAPAFASSRIAYVEQPYRIDYFAFNEWADPPARMLGTLLTRQLTNSGLFRYVVADTAGVDETLRLDSELIELVQSFSPTASEVRVTLRFDLVDVRRRTLLFSETISVTEPAAAREPYAGVVAANHAVQRVADRLVTLLHDPVLAVARQTTD